MRLEDLAIERPTAQVRLGALTLTLRPLTSAEREAMTTDHYPPPTPTTRVIQDASGTRYEPDFTTTDYTRRTRARNQVIRAACVAVAIGYEPKGHDAWSPDLDAKRGLAWMRAASAELDGRFSDAEMEHIYNRLLLLERQEFDERSRVGSADAPGNSSGQTPDPQPGDGHSPTATA